MARSLIAIILLLLSGISAAQESHFSYSFVQASYSKSDYDNLNIDGDGLGIAVTAAISDRFHVFGGYQGADIDDNADADGWNVGIGLNVPMSELMDIVVQLSYETTEVTAPTIGRVDDDGFALGAGARVGANEWIEIYGGLTYVDLDSGNETVFDAGFLLNLSDAFAVGISGNWDDDVSVWSIDGRLYFD